MSTKPNPHIELRRECIRDTIAVHGIYWTACYYRKRGMSLTAFRWYAFGRI